MSLSPDQLQADLSALNQARAARGLDAGIRAAAERDAVINPRGRGGAERFSWDKLSSLPREVTSFQILGKSVGDLAKEAVRNSVAGALLKAGFGATWIGGIGPGAIAVSVAGGATMGGVREHNKRVYETWRRMREEQGIEGVKKLGKGDTLKGFFNPDHKVSITFAIGRGAAFGAAGNIIAGEWFANTGAGQLIREGFSRVGETVGGTFSGLGGAARGAVDTAGGAKNAIETWKDTWGLPGTGGPQELPVSAESALSSPILEVPADAPEAIVKVYQDPEFINRMQDIVTQQFNQADNYTNQALVHLGIDPNNLSEDQLERARWYIKYDLNELVNKKFADAILEGVQNGQDIHQILGQGQQNLENFLIDDRAYFDDDFVRDLKSVIGQTGLAVAPREFPTDLPTVIEIPPTVGPVPTEIIPQPAPESVSVPEPVIPPGSEPEVLPQPPVEPAPVAEVSQPSEITSPVEVPPETLADLSPALVEKIANIPSEVLLEKGSNPWEVASKTLEEILGRPPTNAEILELTKEIAKESHIAVSSWGISGPGFVEHTNIPIGYKLVFNDSVKSVISSLASK